MIIRPAVLAWLIAVSLLAPLLAGEPPHSAAAGPLVIGTPGVYDGGGQVIDVGCGSDHSVEINASNVTLRNYTLRNASKSAVEIGAVSNVTLDGVMIEEFNCSGASDKTHAGVACRNCTALTITNSRIETTRHYGNGIWVKNNSPSTGGGHLISGNTIAGGWDCIGGEPENEAYGTFHRDTVIERNVISDCWDDAIQVEGGTANVHIRDNRIERSAIGIAFAPSTSGPLYIERNTILAGRPGHYGTTFAFKMGDGGSGTVHLTDNYVNTPGDGFKQTNSGLNITVVSKNNTIQVTRYVIEFKDSPAAGTTMDSDCLWTTDSSRFAKWADTKYGSLSEFQAATGQEPNGQQSQACSDAPPQPTSPDPSPPEPTDSSQVPPPPPQDSSSPQPPGSTGYGSLPPDSAADAPGVDSLEGEASEGDAAKASNKATELDPVGTALALHELEVQRLLNRPPPAGGVGAGSLSEGCGLLNCPPVWALVLLPTLLLALGLACLLYLPRVFRRLDR